jgi:hypothetical protein
MLGSGIRKAARPGWSYTYEDTSPTSVRYVLEAHGIDSPIGHILVYGSEQKTTIAIECKMVELYSLDAPEPTRLAYELVSGALESFVNEAIRTIEEKLSPVAPEQRTANEILKSYYRKRARNPKLKLSAYLKSIGEEAREGYIRKVKVAYDKQHRHIHKG